jgi:branched-subunit amino acid aminotransferase/4-amino-4-deoxychorismate lyase
MIGADEVFVASTGAGVMPQLRIDDQTIENGAAEPVTRLLQDGSGRSPPMDGTARW